MADRNRLCDHQPRHLAIGALSCARPVNLSAAGSNAAADARQPACRAA